MYMPVDAYTPAATSTYQLPSISSSLANNRTEMNSVDLGRCKRIVQYLWDPEPQNDEEPNAPIWCLGKEYPRHLTRNSDSCKNQKSAEMTTPKTHAY